MHEFAELIGNDPVMAGKVLAAANSAVHLGRGPARDLQRCLETLGIERVRTIVISQAVFQSLQSLPVLRRAELGPFWRHSLLAAAVAREVAKRSNGVNEDEAYLAGLLHDIGRLGLLAAAPDFYAEGLSAEDSAAQCLTERRWLQVDHAEAGAWLIERWRLSRALVDSVRYHHEPLRRLAGTDPLIRIVALAHLVAEESPDANVVAGAAALCDMDLAELSELVGRANGKLAGAAEQLGIKLDGSGKPLRSSAAAQQLEEEIEPLLVATTVLATQTVSSNGSRYLHDLAATARLVFHFSEVVPMVRDEQQRLRWVDAGEPAADVGALHPWREFSLPIDAGTRIGEALAASRPVFIDRVKDASDILSVAEDQMLRLLSTNQLICLPIRLAAKDGATTLGALVCVGDPALMTDLAGKRVFLSAFMARAEASQRRAAKDRAEAERVREQLVSRQQSAARDLAHEINNPLAIIQNYLAVLDIKLGTAEGLGHEERRDLNGDIALLQQELARVGRLVQTLGSAESAVAAPGAVDLNRLIGDVVQLFRRSAGAAGIEISSGGQQAAPEPLIERDKLEQVLVNLVKNAVEAMSTPDAIADARPEGAQIVVQNNGLVHRDGRLLLEISVRDNGPGIPTDRLARLLAGSVDAEGVTGDEPVSADRFAHRSGRGRGLRIVQSLVHATGGAIQCRSSGFGTTFDIFLPCRQAVVMSEPELESP